MRNWRFPMKRRDDNAPSRPHKRYRDETGVARCPKCEAPLGLKYTRRGPAYVCRCPARRAA
jgi:ssDNA-binding Zn-finger/Zn-ribbon topoisomerase 1